MGKIGRNDPCPCGSGKKYKKCCWLKEVIPPKDALLFPPFDISLAISNDIANNLLNIKGIQIFVSSKFNDFCSVTNLSKERIVDRIDRTYNLVAEVGLLSNDIGNIILDYSEDNYQAVEKAENLPIGSDLGVAGYKNIKKCKISDIEFQHLICFSPIYFSKALERYKNMKEYYGLNVISYEFAHAFGARYKKYEKESKERSLLFELIADSISFKLGFEESPPEGYYKMFLYLAEMFNWDSNKLFDNAIYFSAVDEFLKKNSPNPK